MSVNIRKAKVEDVPHILEIYSYYVLNSIATAEEVPPTLTEMTSRFQAIVDANFPYLVLESNGEILGYCYAGKFNTRTAYRFSAENTVYIKNGCHGGGYGKLLMSELISQLKTLGIKHVVANIANPPSISFHKSLGFLTVGTFEDIIFKFGKWHNTIFMQLKI